MHRIILILFCTCGCMISNAQLYLADNGLTASGTGTSKTVSLGGTLNNAATSIDFGSGNSSSNFLLKKGTSNYFFVGNDGKIGMGTNSPQSLLHLHQNTTDGYALRIENANASGSTPYAMFSQIGTNGWGVSGWANAAILEGAAAGGLVMSAYNGDIKFQTSTARYTRMTILENGNVGIGTGSPSTKLTVYGSVENSATFRGAGTGAATIQVENSNGYYANFGVEGSGIVSLKSNNTVFLYGSSAGNVGIGTSAPNSNAKLDVNGNIFSSGKIAIGTTDMAKISTYSLAVNGDAIFNKVKVKLYSIWPDYVFYKNYDLVPLEDVEKFIRQHNHLPGVPSAKEVEENGLDLGDNQATLLKKIEELTLYVIDQNKKIEEQQLRIKILEQQQTAVKNLQEELEKIKVQLAGKK